MKNVARETFEMILNMEESLKQSKLSSFNQELNMSSGAQITILKKIDIENCYLCGAEHLNLQIRKVEKQLEWYNYIATCPFKNLPIYIKFVTG